MALTKRLVKGSALTAAEHDANLDYALARGNHTGSQAAATISDLASAVAAVSAVAANTGKRTYPLSDETKVAQLTVTAATNLDDLRTRVAELDAAIVLQGVWDASASTFPGSGSAQAGDSWIVSVAGTVDSVAFAVGDRIIAISDNAATDDADDWFKADYTDLVSAVAGLTGTISTADLKTALALPDDTENDLAGKQSLFTGGAISDEEVDLAAAMNGERIFLTGDAPVLTVRADATEALADDFACVIYTVNPATITFAAGVAGNGVTASSWTLAPRPAGVNVIREATDDLSLVGAVTQVVA